jgi:hypothetical protein
MRFGNLQFESGGERIRLNGDYQYDGQLLYRFGDDQHNDQGPHEYFHSYGQDDTSTRLAREHMHFVMSQLDYYLGQLDDPAYADDNGRSILDNALLLIGTDLGHKSPGDSHHLLQNVFHAVSGANGRFRTGQGTLNAPDGTHASALYNACLQGLGLPRRVGGGQLLSGVLR